MTSKSTGSIVVNNNNNNNNGTEMAYIDSGAPRLDGKYTTIFAVHGVCFPNIFNKVSVIAKSKGLRFVAITRRGYKGSTPFSDEELSALSGSDSEKEEWLMARGLEIVDFINHYVERANLHAISADGKKGGFALLGWSAGATFTAAAVVQFPINFAAYFRAHILQDPPSIAFGLPLPPQTYSPELDTCIPAKSRTTAFTVWLTSYFQHGDLSTGDLNNIDYAVPGTLRAPSIYNMSQSEIAEIERIPFKTIDDPMLFGMMPQSNAIYQKAIFDKSVRERFPHMQVWDLIGDATASFGLAALWSIQEDDKAFGGNNVKYKIVPHMNHFMHWDEPELTVQLYLEMLF